MNLVVPRMGHTSAVYTVHHRTNTAVYTLEATYGRCHVGTNLLLVVLNLERYSAVDHIRERLL